MFRSLLLGLSAWAMGAGLVATPAPPRAGRAPVMLQHRGAPHGPGELENTVEGALLALDDEDTAGIEIDVYHAGGAWHVGHDRRPARHPTLAAYLAEVGPRLLARRKLLLVEIKATRVSPRRFAEFDAVVQRETLRGQTIVLSFNENDELRPFAAAGYPVGFFVWKQRTRESHDLDGALALIDRYRRQLDGPLQHRLFYRWAKGSLSDSQALAFERALIARSRDGDDIRLWFTGVGKKTLSPKNARITRATVDRLAAIKRRVGAPDVVVSISDEPGIVRANYRAAPRYPENMLSSAR